MSSLLSVAGLLGLLLALVGLCKGSLRSLGLSSRKQCATAAATAFAVMLVGGAMAPEPAPVPAVDRAAQVESQRDPESSASPPVASPQPTTPSPVAEPTHSVAPSPAPPQAVPPPSEPEPGRSSEPVAPLLVMAGGGDGDSWRDTDGVEYRMGLINTPESQECGGAAATAYRRRALAAGFRAEVYATDDFGRRVSVIRTAKGVNLNVAMAREGIADDRYLERFRHENPVMAAELDAAFSQARAAGRGIWTTCSASGSGGGGANPAQEPAPAPQPIAGGRCHPDYETCIPVRGDGSGRGAANDLDCGEIGQPVRLRRIGRDPYRLDGNDRDGVGCE